MEKKKLVIIGSGPAGFTAALYAARAQLEPLLFEGLFSGTAGGQLMTTTEVENYPGFVQPVQGPELMMLFKRQAQRFGTQVLADDVIKVDFFQKPFEIYGKKYQCLADSVIVATGATAKRLDVEGTKEGQFWQKGVSACAVCDGAMPLFRGKVLIVVGGGDTAMEEALFLTKFATKVIILHRRAELRASKIMATRAQAHPKIEILYNTVLVKVEGQKVVDCVTVENKKDHVQKKIAAAGVFFAIGHQPNTQFLQGQLALDEVGYIQVQPGSTKTSISGVFAAGDVQDRLYRQAVTAAGSGCMAALDAERYLSALESAKSSSPSSFKS